MSSSRQRHDLLQCSFSKCITEVKLFPFFIHLVLEKVTGDERVERGSSCMLVIICLHLVKENFRIHLFFYK